MKPILYVCRSAQESQSSNRIELSWFIQDLLYFFWFQFPWLWGWAGGWGYAGWPTIVYMSSGVFRGKESSNRIEISWLVQDLLKFGVLCSLQTLGKGQVGGGVWGHGVCPHTCAHACVCIHVRACMEHPHTNPHPPNPNPSTPPPRGTPWISKNSITLELIKMIQICLKIWNLSILPHPWVGVWLSGQVGGWVGWRMGSGQTTKNLINLDLIEIIKFCLKIYDL